MDDVFTAEFFADPHAAYTQLRERGPVHHVVTPNHQQVWLVIGHAEARTAMADPRFSKDTHVAQQVYERHTEAPAQDRDFAAGLSAHMLNTDPPEHTRLRKLVGAAFTPRRVEQLRARISEITDQLVGELVAKLDAGDTVDLLDTLAIPLPTAVICELLGIPEQNRDEMRGQITALLSIGDVGVIDRASQALAGLLIQTLDAKREQPADDLLSGLIAAHDAGDRLSGPELVSMAMLLLIAGHETTVNVIANGALALLQNPEAVATVRDDRSVLPAAIEELLRYDGPTNCATFRFTTESVDLGGVEVPAEHPVVVSVLAANRDPVRFPDPHAMQIGRDTSGHLAFGHGVHHCLGAALGRMEATIVFGALLDRLPQLALATSPDQLRWRRSILVRGLEELPVTWRGGGR